MFINRKIEMKIDTFIYNLVKTFPNCFLNAKGIVFLRKNDKKKQETTFGYSPASFYHKVYCKIR